MATVVISFWLCTYYNVIMSWSMVYLSSSFSDPLPWTDCHNDWNTNACWAVADDNQASENEEGEKVSSTQEFYE